MATATGKLSVIKRFLQLQGVGNSNINTDTEGSNPNNKKTAIKGDECFDFAFANTSTTTSASCHDDDEISNNDALPLVSLSRPSIPVTKIKPSQLIPTHLSPHIKHSYGEFYTTRKWLCFDSNIITQLMAAGFIPISTKYRLMPKLHKQRCVIHLQQDYLQANSFSSGFPSSSLHVPRSIRKKSKRYRLSINTSFDEVVKGCHAQHGVNWLWPKIVKAFRELHEATLTGSGTPTQLHHCHLPSTSSHPSLSSNKTIPIRLYSVELYNIETNNLAAGELGYTVGSIYTSLTGFTSESSAGSIQLAALGKLLTSAGFSHWDLGTEFEYKQRLGAVMVEREDFLRLLCRVRQEAEDNDCCVLGVSGGEYDNYCTSNAKQIIDNVNV